MPTLITLKKSAVPAKVPTTSDLALGEVAINTYDGKVFIKKNVSGTESIVDLSNALTLNGQSGSYYLDFTNATNKPDPQITVTLTGDVTGTAAAKLEDLTSNTITVSTTIAANSVALGTDTTGNYTDRVVVSGTGLSVSGTTSQGNVITITSNATNNNTASTIVARDANGDFTARTVTANITGTASNATLLNGQNAAYYLNFTNATNKPDPQITVTLTGGVTGSASAKLEDLNSNTISIVTTIGANAVVLGANTTGNYTDRVVVSGTGLSVSGTTSQGNVITITSNATNNNTGSTIVARDANGDFVARTITANITGTASNATLLAGQAASYYLDFTNATNKPDPQITVTLTGDVTGTASAKLEDLNSNTITVSTTIAANSVALGADTTGNYTDRVVVSGTGLSVSGTATEGNVITITSNATNNNTGSTIVARDANGDFVARTITANITGTASNATLLNGQNAAYYLDFTNATNKPDPQITVTLTGVVTGSASAKLEDLNSNTITVATTLATLTGNVVHNSDSNTRYFYFSRSGSLTNEFTRVGRDDITTYFYTKNDETTSTVRFDFENTDTEAGGGAGANFSYFEMVGSSSPYMRINGNTVWHQGNDGSGSGLDADLLDGQDGSYYLNWTNITSKPDPQITVTLTGDVTGTASAKLEDLTSNTITVSTTIAANSVALGTDTTGNYTDRVVVSGTGLSVSGTATEGNVITITSNATNNNTASTIVARDANGDFTARTVTANIIGNVTGTASNATVLQTARNINGVSFNGSADINVSNIYGTNGTLTFVTNGVTSGVNYLHANNAPANGTVNLTTAGTSANIDLLITTKGNGSVIVDTGVLQGNLDIKTGAASLRLWDDNSSHYYRFVTGDRSANYNINLPAGDVTLTAGTTVVTEATNQTIGGIKTFSGNVVAANVQVTGTQDVTSKSAISGVLTVAGGVGIAKQLYVGSNIYATGNISLGAVSTRDKFRVWDDSSYTIGMQNSITFGSINNDYAMTFQMNNDNNRGWWWGRADHSTSQGAMSLSTQGRLSVANSLRLGYGINDSVLAGANAALDVSGNTIVIGNFGVGTYAPLQKVDMRGDMNLNLPANCWVSTGVRPSDESGLLYHHGSYRTAWVCNGYRNNATQWISLNINGQSGASSIEQDPTGFIVFNTDSSKASGSSITVTERMRLAASGNLGIGTSNPIEKLQVAGNVLIGTTGNVSYIGFAGTTGDGSGSYNHTYIAERVYGGSEQSELFLFKGNDFQTPSGPDRIRLAAADIQFDTYTTATSGAIEAVATSGNLTPKMLIKSSGNVLIGTTTDSGYKLEVNGSFAAITKSFLIPHPTKKNKRLQYASLEGPENGVYVRGRLKNKRIIELPDYWVELVDKDSITVNLTPVGKKQNIFVHSIIDNKIIIAGEETIDCFYIVYAERKDVAKLEVEIDGD